MQVGWWWWWLGVAVERHGCGRGHAKISGSVSACSHRAGRGRRPAVKDGALHTGGPWHAVYTRVACSM